MKDLDRALSGIDCALFVDCSDPRRAGLEPRELEGFGCVINVDHHPSNTLFGAVNYVDATASAAAEQVRLIISGLDVPLDRDMALSSRITCTCLSDLKRTSLLS